MPTRIEAERLLARYGYLLREQQRLVDSLDRFQLRRQGKRPPVPSREALRLLATEEGISVSYARNKLYRCKRAMEAEETGADTINVAHLETYGLPVPQSWLVEQNRLRQKMATCHMELLRIASNLEQHCQAASYPKSYADSARRAIDEADRRLLDAMPAGLCPYCKGLDPYQDECGFCDSTGVATAASVRKVNPKLKSRDPLVVVLRGSYLQLDVDTLEQIGELPT